MPRPNSYGSVLDQRVEPPADLSGPEKELFLDVVLAVRPDHFQPVDAQLLADFCRAKVVEREAAEKIKRGPATPVLIKTWLAAHQIADKLVCRLKISPQARFHKRDHKPSAAPVSYYDRMRLDEAK
jgi:hypothetical protein